MDLSSLIVGVSSYSPKQKTMDDRSQNEVATSNSDQSKLICDNVNVALN